MRDDYGWFRQTLTAMLFGALLMAGFPAVAAQVGDALALGEVNKIDDRTDLKGDAKGANLQIKNTGNARALTAKADKIAVLAKATSGPVAISAKASRNAIKIKVDDGQAPIKVNPSAGTATNLSADQLDGMEPGELDVDKVDGMDADGLVRVASDAANNLPDGDEEPFLSGGGDGDVLSVSITAPTAGWLIITATVDALNTSALDVYSCHIRVNDSSVTGTLMGSRLDGAGTTNTSEDCTTHGVQEVAAGTHIVDLRLISVGSTTIFEHGSLSVLFVPFDGTGAQSDL